MQDPYIGGAQRIVTFQQAFDLKPWGNTGTYHYSERSTILDSQVLQPPPFRALSVYAASFFPKGPSSATSSAFSEVRQQSVLYLRHAVLYHHQRLILSTAASA